jgi:Mlc titration factor MtfA (ptsG expression regulator)
METTPLPISPLLVVADRFMQQERWASIHSAWLVSTFQLRILALVCVICGKLTERFRWFDMMNAHRTVLFYG